MAKKYSLPLLILGSLYFASITPSFAAMTSLDFIPPVQPNSSKVGPCTKGLSGPGDVCPNFSSNNTLQDDKDSCSRSYSFGGMFDPKETTSSTYNSQTGTTTVSSSYVPYDVNELTKDVDLPRPDSNPFSRGNAMYTANHYDLCASNEERQKAALNYEVGKGLNSATLSTDIKYQRCLKGQRLTAAVLSLSSKCSFPNNTTNDRDIAWTEGGSCTSRRVGGSPIRLSQIAKTLATAQDPSTKLYYFYNPYSPCTPSSKPVNLYAAIDQAFSSVKLDQCPSPDDFRSDILNKIKSSSTTSFADLIYSNLDLNDIGASQQNLQVTNIDKGLIPRPTNIPFQVAFGQSYSRNALTTYNMNVPLKQKRASNDLCGQLTDSNTPDQKSPLTFFAFVRKFFGTVTDKPQLFSTSVSTQHSFPKEVKQVNDVAQTSMTDYLPLEHQKGLNTIPINGTSNKITADYNGPVNSAVMQQLRKELYPIEWQKKYGL